MLPLSISLEGLGNKNTPRYGAGKCYNVTFSCRIKHCFHYNGEFIAVLGIL
jgi:hypothetical protein